MYEYASNQYKEEEFLVRMSDVKQIHTLLMRYEKEMGFYIGGLGCFRKGRAEVAHSTFTPVSEFYVGPAMTLLVKWINYHLKKKKYDAVELAAIAHVWFESIHPFSDGNGRTGRILLSYILIGCGLANIAIKGISKKDREFYYGALEKADDAFESIHREIEQGKKFDVHRVDEMVHLESFDELKKIVIDRLGDAVERLKKIDLNLMADDGSATLASAAAFYDYSPDYLRNLINRGKVKGVKKGKTWHVRVQDMAEYVKKQKKA